MLSDIEIAHSVKLKPIEQLAHEIGLTDAEFEPRQGKGSSEPGA